VLRYIADKTWPTVARSVKVYRQQDLAHSGP